MPAPIYSLTAALNAATRGTSGGFETEIHQQLCKSLPQAPQGFLIPLSALAVKAQVADLATAGGFTVSTIAPTVANALRPASLAIRLGALMLDAAPNVVIPGITSGATAFWLGETEECPESQIALSALNLKPHRCASWIKVSNQLLAQAPIAETVLARDICNAVGSALDLGLLSGVGGVEPLGLLENAAVPKNTFGAAATRAKLAGFERSLGDGNADDSSAVWITSPAVREKWRTTKNDATGIGFLWDDSNKVLGRPAFASNNITEDRVILGDFRDLVVVNWGVIEILDRFTQKRHAVTELLFQIHADGGPMRRPSFTVSTDAGNQ